MGTVQSWAYLSERGFPEEFSIALKRTFNSCQRWFITCHTYICTVRAPDGFPSLCQVEIQPQYRATETRERLIRLEAELSDDGPARTVRAGWDGLAWRMCVIQSRWMRQAGFIQLERDTMWWGFLLPHQQRHTQTTATPVSMLHPAFTYWQLGI